MKQQMNELFSNQSYLRARNRQYLYWNRYYDLMTGRIGTPEKPGKRELAYLRLYKTWYKKMENIEKQYK